MKNNHFETWKRTQRITPSHSPRRFAMKVFQTFSIMTSSVHNLSMSRRWTSGSRKNNGDNRVISADRPRFGLSYTVWSWASRACLWPWKYKNLQCAGYMYELTNADHRAGRQVSQKNDSKRAEWPYKWWLRNFMYCVLTSPCNVVCLISLCLWARSQRSSPSYLNLACLLHFVRV